MSRNHQNQGPRVFFDTDAASKLCAAAKFEHVIAWRRKCRARTFTSDTTAAELAAIADEGRRIRLGQKLARLLGGKPLLAPFNLQLKWGIFQFMGGRAAFEPYATPGSEFVMKCLASPAPLSEALLRSLAEKRTQRAESWESMHTAGRPNLRNLFRQSKELPTSRDWMDSLLHSDFAAQVFTDVVTFDSRPLDQERAKSYLLWNPMARCFMEQFLLAVKRHGVENERASSKKGPQWNDYYQGAFVGVMDCVVTDDRRLRNALEQHRRLREQKTWCVLSLDDFRKWARTGEVPEELPRNRYTEWRLQAPPTETCNE